MSPQPIAGWSEHGNADDPTNFVFYETARDMHAQPQWPGMVALATWNDRVSAHEALHRFFGWHAEPNAPSFPTAADEGIMDPQTAATAATVSLTDRQFRLVQKKDYPR
jgi:hypothetical protein